MNTETTGTEKGAPELTAVKLKTVEGVFQRYLEAHGIENYWLRCQIAWSLMTDMPFLLSMARRTAEAEEKLKAAEAENAELLRDVNHDPAKWEEVRPGKYQLRELSRLANKSKGYGSEGCTCQLIESFGIEIDQNCPVHGVEGE